LGANFSVWGYSPPPQATPLEPPLAIPKVGHEGGTYFVLSYVLLSLPNIKKLVYASFFYSLLVLV